MIFLMLNLYESSIALSDSMNQNIAVMLLTIAYCYLVERRITSAWYVLLLILVNSRLWWLLACTGCCSCRLWWCSRCHLPVWKPSLHLPMCAGVNRWFILCDRKNWWDGLKKFRTQNPRMNFHSEVGTYITTIMKLLNWSVAA